MPILSRCTVYSEYKKFRENLLTKFSWIPHRGKIFGTEQLGHVSLDRLAIKPAWTSQTGQKERTECPENDRKDMTARTGHPRQDRWDRTVRQDGPNMTTWKGQQEQEGWG